MKEKLEGSTSANEIVKLRDDVCLFETGGENFVSSCWGMFRLNGSAYDLLEMLRSGCTVQGAVVLISEMYQELPEAVMSGVRSLIAQASALELAVIGKGPSILKKTGLARPGYEPPAMLPVMRAGYVTGTLTVVGGRPQKTTFCQ